MIDASSLAKYVNREEGWEIVEEYLLDGCVTVELAVKEVLNSIWKRVMRGDLDKESGLSLCRTFIENIMVRIYPQEELYFDAIEISLRNDVTIYDSLYISLAKKLDTPLITSDVKQSNIAKREGIETILID